MKFTLQARDLQEVLPILQNAVATNTPYTELTGLHTTLHNGVLCISSTDTNVVVSVCLQCEGTDGVTIIPAKIFCEYIKTLSPSDTVVCTNADQEMTVSARSGKVKIKTLNPENYPKLEKKEEDIQDIRITLDQLLSLFVGTVPVTSNNKSRPALAGVYLANTGNELYALATDTFRMGMSSYVRVHDDIVYGILPKEIYMYASSAAKFVKGGENITLRISRNTAELFIGNFNMLFRMCTGEFPEVKKTLSTFTMTGIIEVERELMLQAVQQVQLFSKLDLDKVDLEFNYALNKLVLKSSELEVGSGVFEVPFRSILEHSEKKQEIKLNGSYVIQALRLCKTDTVRIEMIGQFAPIFFKETQELGYIHMIMPLRT